MSTINTISAADLANDPEHLVTDTDICVESDLILAQWHCPKSCDVAFCRVAVS